MKWTGLNELREAFLSFFEEKAHTRLPSAPLVPLEDQSLLLINSGMAPLKKYFLGTATPPSKRVTTCQKCIRTPDIERVGKTARHGTYFEMLGNFSFGDYFKREATAWAWEFITQRLQLPVDRLYVSIYLDDDQAYDIWTKEVGVAPDHMVRLGKADNFWEIGAGPCGPCSEIYFDRGAEYGCDSPTCAVGCDCDRYVEFWNLVFTQFNTDGNGTYTPLEHPNIDTGMGLERLACILQGVGNLFEVDTVQKIMTHISDIAGIRYGENEKSDVSLRVITDHIRSTTMLIGDGVVPGNEGRGYVLRRLLRRAARHGRLLGITRPFLHEVCETVIQENAAAYPDLVRGKDYIVKVISVEEDRFARTIDQGIELLSSLIDKVDSRMDQPGALSGAEAFRLYDTYGFPIDLTREILAERGWQVDEDEFAKLMDEQRKRARDARAAMGDVGWVEDLLAAQKLQNEFVGYTQLDCEAKIQAILADGEISDNVGEGAEATIVLDKTPFYAESGGQVGDTGLIMAGNAVMEVYDCRKSADGVFLHIGKMRTGVLSKGDTVTAQVDRTRRLSIMRNHTACHLLQAALREVLGTHVHQAGSMVDAETCRFDFSHFSAMTPGEIQETEDKVNALVLGAFDVNISEMDIKSARDMGAMALFGEKYGDRVRVCNVSGKSIELCGGTHVTNTSLIGLFKICKESSVAAGVRRIEATTGAGVLALIAQNNHLILAACEHLKLGNPADLPKKTEALVAELRQKDREIASLNEKMANQQAGKLFENAQIIGGVRLVSAQFSGIKAEALRAMSDNVKAQHPDVVAILSSIDGDKGNILVVCGADAQKAGAHAGKLCKELTSLIGGSGGGRPDSAMGGVSAVMRIDEAIAKAPELLAAQLQS